MRWLWIFLAAVAGALAGASLLQDPGYVLVRAGSWVFESSIAAGVISALAVLLTIFMVGAGLRHLISSFGMFGRWRSARQLSRSSDQWQRAIKAIAVGNWSMAADLLSGAGIPPERRLEAWLVQAQALWQRRDAQALASLLARAQRDSPEVHGDLVLATSRWQILQGDAKSALASLAKVTEPARGSSAWAGLYALGCVEQRQWDSLQRHWSLVDKSGVLKDPAFRQQMPRLRAGKAMADTVMAKGADGWRSGHKLLPKQWRSDPNTLDLWAEFLMDSGREEPAFALLESELKKQRHSVLVRRFGGFTQPKLQLLAIERAQAWRVKQPNDAELLLTLGRLLKANGQIDQARTHLLAALDAIGGKQGTEPEPQDLEDMILIELGGLATLDQG